MSSDDSDDELLANLLAAADSEDSKPANTDNTEQPKPKALKELDFNFLDDVSSDIINETPGTKSPKKIKNSDSLLEDHANSSDEEDKKYFENQRYSEYGREIKNLLKNKETEKSENLILSSCFKKGNNCNSPSNNINKTPTNSNLNSKGNSPSLSTSFNKLSQKSDKYNLQVQSSPNNAISKDVYKDPVFGLRMIKPLISSAELTEKMRGRKAVTVSIVKLHLANQSAGNEAGDWVIAGVLLNKSATKTSQKGSQYCIWKISDLSTDMKTISVFLFNKAYSQFWKLSIGAVVAILNPSVLENRDDKDLATLSVDNAQKIMILGTSRDLGKCKSVKKNGEPCTAPVNLSTCEYCVYHVKQEYGKYSRRSELQTTGARRAFGAQSNPLKKVGVSQQRHPDALPFIAIPAKRNEALYKKDCERLALLRGEKKMVEKNGAETTCEMKGKVKSVELSSNQVKKDSERLNKLRVWDTNKKIDSPPIKEEKKAELKFSLPSPKLGAGMKGGIIDFSEPVPKNLLNKAKLNAIEWVKKNGSIKKTNPNKIRPSKEVQNEKGVKRRREEEEGEAIAEEKAKKEDIVRTKFQEMLEMKSSHSDLIEKHENEETEQYFRKLEAKERMEEKMLTTFKVDCKAVRCSVCKYVAFSSSELCKKLQHPIKVIDAVKRFFKCGDCGNRTISLDRIPTETCKKCASSKWVKTSMMDEKRTQVAGSKLCIRGGEEKFIGSAITDASLNLLVPESD